MRDALPGHARAALLRCLLGVGNSRVGAALVPDRSGRPGAPCLRAGTGLAVRGDHARRFFNEDGIGGHAQKPRVITAGRWLTPNASRFPIVALLKSCDAQHSP